MLRTWCELHRAWYPDEEAFPLTVDKLYAVGAMLKHGGYRSARNVFSRAKDFHIELNYEWTDSLQRVLRRVCRSICRGIGPARQPAALPLDEVAASSTLGVAPLVERGPVNPRAVVIAGSFFLTREIEASLARRGHITFDTTRLCVTWNLPCSKTDPSALGKQRSWGCVCSEAAGPCVYCTLVDHCAAVDRLFGDSGEGVSPLFPLFPSATGEFVSKDAMVESIKAVAEGLGLPVLSKEGRELFGGHSLRITGARWMATRGIPLLTIQLLARWSSSIIMRYVADAPLDAVTDEYRRLNSKLSLKSVLARQGAGIVEVASSLNLSKEASDTLWEEVHLLKSQQSALQDEVGALTTKCNKRLRDSPEFVINPASDKVHRTACTELTKIPPLAWRSICGWRFGLGPFSLTSEFPRPDKACIKCLPELTRDDSASE